MSLVVRTGPQEYECRVGVLETITDRLTTHHYKKVVLIHGTQSWNVAKPYLDTLFESEIDYELSLFNGECTYAEVDRIAELAQEIDADVIIGVGGGKLCDTVKYAAAKVSGVQSILLPTLASNCAPWTPLSVMYDDEGVCLGFDIHNEQVGILLIEPELILNSPVNYFIAGVADTLAKWYESDVILSQPEHQTNAFLLMARAAALNCRDNIVQHGLQAVEDIQTQSLTPAFTQIVETIIAISGLVGGLGDSYARTTIGHAVHDKITIFPESHAYLHGEKVAYGVLVQLAVEHKWDEIDQLSTFYTELNLPKSLKDLKLGHLTDEQINTFARQIKQDETLVSSGYPVTQDELHQAMTALEAYMKLRTEV
ncbi:iron-containing alcohol dehydrogenase family protein [Marinilactibacillus sp. Marseille-P9653]|uniref:iron-containing alcohol dehydrogenase family protein n=1 Tax=Marinilactibacillus sp. Marseille-P9653 TaxID=2866583 RepID=UPI001CE47B1F|nr:iron-containing alcohol dehydrogenase family protein [Marinilactibacillus sp. Marseille-P9653]